MKSVALKQQEVRLPRYLVSELAVKFSVELDGKMYAIRDISESGFSVETSGVPSISSRRPCRIFVEDTTLVYEGEVERVPRASELDAYMFTSKPLSRNLIENLEKAAFIKHAVESSLDSVELPLPYKNFLIDLRHYLHHVKQRCDELDQKMRVEPFDIKESSNTAIEAVFFPWFFDKMIAFSQTLHGFDRKFSKEQKVSAIALFRESVQEFYLTSDFVSRIIARPRGYVGDYEMMNEIYDNNSVGSSTFARLMYKYGINEVSSQSVRYRRGLFCKRMLAMAGKGPISIASIACGPAREVADFLAAVDPKHSKDFTFYLIDQDQEALLSAKRRLVDIKLNRQLNCEFHFLPLSVKDVISGSNSAGALGQIGFDFVYSAGLYDYLTQPAAKLLTGILADWLKPNGSMIVGNYNTQNSTHAISEYSAGWPLILRDEPEMLDLVPAGRKHEMHWDDNKINIYLEIRK